MPSLIPDTLARLSLPPDITGTTFRLKAQKRGRCGARAGTKSQADSLTGSRFASDPFRLTSRRELAAFTDIEFIDLLGLPMDDVKRRIATLPDDAAVYYTNLWVDDAGANFIPAEVVRLLADVANRPIVSDNLLHMGRGSTGGFLALPEPMGEEAGRRALRILDGETASRFRLLAETLQSRSSIGASFNAGTSAKHGCRPAARYDSAQRACGSNIVGN